MICPLVWVVYKRPPPNTVLLLTSALISSVQFSHSVVSSSLWPHELQQAMTTCPSPTPGVMSIEWVMPSIHHILCRPFSFCHQSFPASGYFQMRRLFASCGQSIGVSASTSVLPMNTGLISFRMDWLDLLAAQRTLRVFSNTTVQKHQFFSTQISL